MNRFIETLNDAMEAHLRAQQRIEVVIMAGAITFCVVAVGVAVATVLEARRSL